MLGATGDLVYQALSYGYPIGVNGEPASVTKATFPLLSNHPNPMRGRTNITFDLPKAGAYEFRLFNIAGQIMDRMTGIAQFGPNYLSMNAGRLATRATCTR